MNVKEYISSGIVESYVLGLVTEAERQEFEAHCLAHPEIAAARTAFEQSLEEQLLRDAKQAPAQLKGQIESRLTTTSMETAQDLEETETPVRRMGAWKWLAAASLILMAGAAYWAFTTNNKYQNQRDEIARLRDSLQKISVEMDSLYANFEVIGHKGMRMASLKGTNMAPEAQVTIYWDTAATRDVFMVVNNLPQPPSDKQYQLWALFDNKPIDLGVFDMYDIRQRKLVVRMQNVQKAQAFAITLEQKGGSQEGPKGDMYVMGSL